MPRRLTIGALALIAATQTMDAQPGRRRTTQPRAPTPAAPATPARPAAPAPVLKVVADAHALLLRADGTLLGWGRFRNGQLGEEPVLTSRRRFGVAAPVPIALPGRVTDIAVGIEGSYALLENGTVYAWGGNRLNDLGLGGRVGNQLLPNEERGIPAPMQIPGLADVVQIGASGHSALALLRDGTMRAWGARDGGVLGDDVEPASWDASIESAATPTEVVGLRNVAQFAVASAHAVAVTRDGRVYAWGYNSAGQVGTGSRRPTVIPHPVEVPGLRDVVSVAAGNGVSAALKRDGTVWVWGASGTGAFGIPEPNGTITDSSGWFGTPRPVPGVRNVAALSMGNVGRHVIALLRDGTLRGWGNSDWGQIGAGVSGFFQWEPVTPKLTGVTAVWATGNNTFAVTRDGQFWIWGSELSGTGILAQNHKVPTLFPLP